MILIKGKYSVSENRARQARCAETEIFKWMNEWKKNMLGFKLCTEAEIFFSDALGKCMHTNLL